MTLWQASMPGAQCFTRISAAPPIPPERLIRASLLQVLYAVRSERQLMEQMDCNLMFCWFVGLGIDDPAWGEGRPEIRPVDRFQP